jgi:hypothetical protein
MGAIKKVFDGLGYAFTVQGVLLLLFPAGALVGLGIYLASLNQVMRIFAPVSYLFVAFFVVLFFLTVCLFVQTLAIRAGWKPSQRSRNRILAKNAPFKSVIQYLTDRSAFGSRMHPDTESQALNLLLEREIMDRLSEGRLAIWGRTNHGPLLPINPPLWEHCRVDVKNQEVTVLLIGGLSSATRIFYDVRFNWRQVRRTWPRANVLMKRLRQWAFERQATTASTRS